MRSVFTKQREKIHLEQKTNNHRSAKMKMKKNKLDGLTWPDSIILKATGTSMVKAPRYAKGQ